MLNIKYTIIVIIAFLLGTQANFNKFPPKQTESPDILQKENLKVLVTHTQGSYLMEINNVPEPFDVAGNYPYVLWVNGKRFSVPKNDLKNIVAQIGKENIPDIDRNDIHKGWMRSFFAVEASDFSKPNFTLNKN